MLKPQRSSLNAVSGARFGIGALCLALCALSGASCAKAQAADAPAGPPLQVPDAPPRVVAPVEEAVIAAPPAPPEPPPPAAAPARTPPRTASEPRATPPPAPPPVGPAGPAEPPKELRAAPSATNAATERAVRDVLTRASRDLNRVNYRGLSTDGRATYDQSKRFSQQAEAALRERNFVFAATLADKAATLAAELVNR